MEGVSRWQIQVPCSRAGALTGLARTKQDPVGGMGHMAGFGTGLGKSSEDQGMT